MSEIIKPNKENQENINNINQYNGYQTRVEAEAAFFINSRFPEDTNITALEKTDLSTRDKYLHAGATYYTKEELERLKSQPNEGNNWLRSNKYRVRPKIIFANKPKDQKTIINLN